MCADGSGLREDAVGCAEVARLAGQRVLFFDGSLERSPGRPVRPRRPGPPARDSQRRKPWLPAARRGRGRYRAGCSGDERAPGAPALCDSSASGPAIGGEKAHACEPGAVLASDSSERAVWRSVAPQRVREDPDGSAGGPDVLDLTCGNPVVNRATADSDSLAGLHDREGLAVHICSRGLSSRRPSEVCTKGPQGPEHDLKKLYRLLATDP